MYAFAQAYRPLVLSFIHSFIHTYVVCVVVADPDLSRLPLSYFIDEEEEAEERVDEEAEDQREEALRCAHDKCLYFSVLNTE